MMMVVMMMMIWSQGWMGGWVEEGALMLMLGSTILLESILRCGNPRFHYFSKARRNR